MHGPLGGFHFDGPDDRGSREWKVGEHRKRSRACARELFLPKISVYR